MIELKIVTSESGDWEALYMNDLLIAEGHSLDAYHVLKALANTLPYKVDTMEVSDEIAELGMPKSLCELSW